MKCRKRVDGAIAEVELGAMALALSESSERADRCLGLSSVKWNDFAAEVFNQPVQAG